MLSSTRSKPWLQPVLTKAATVPGAHLCFSHGDIGRHGLRASRKKPSHPDMRGKRTRLSERLVGSGSWLELASVTPTEASNEVPPTSSGHVDRRIDTAQPGASQKTFLASDEPRGWLRARLPSDCRSQEAVPAVKAWSTRRAEHGKPRNKQRRGRQSPHAHRQDHLTSLPQTAPAPGSCCSRNRRPGRRAATRGCRTTQVFL